MALCSMSALRMMSQSWDKSSLEPRKREGSRASTIHSRKEGKQAVLGQGFSSSTFSFLVIPTSLIIFSMKTHSSGRDIRGDLSSKKLSIQLYFFAYKLYVNPCVETKNVVTES